MDITAKRALRTTFMTWLFNETGGSERDLRDASRFGVPPGWNGDLPDHDDIADVVKYLEGEYLIRAHWSMGGLPSVQLTHTGIREVEEALAAPSKQTEHFVPLVNITNIHGSVVGSQLQQGSPGGRTERNVHGQPARGRGGVHFRRAEDPRQRTSRRRGQGPG